MFGINEVCVDLGGQSDFGVVGKLAQTLKLARLVRTCSSVRFKHQCGDMTQTGLTKSLCVLKSHSH